MALPKFSHEAEQLVQALAHRGDRPVAAELVVAWAVEAMIQDVDSPSLRMLAGLDPADDHHLVEELLERTLAELERPRPAPEEAKRLYYRQLAERLLDGSVAWDVAFEEFVAFYGDGWDPLLGEFERIDDDRDRLRWGERPLFMPFTSERGLKACVRQAAHELLVTLDEARRDESGG